MRRLRIMKGFITFVMALALVMTSFGTVGTRAAGETDTVTAPVTVVAEFLWASNSVKAGSASYVYVLKNKTGNNIKTSDKHAQMTKAANSDVYTVSLADLGITKPKKEVYLYVCDKEFETNATNISANLEIKAPVANKVTAKINYAKEAVYEEVFDVISATATDSSKKEIKNPDIWWSAEENGTYFAVNDCEYEGGRKYNDKEKSDAPNGFDGKTLKEMLDAGGGVIYIKVAGKDGGSGIAQLGSQAVKVKIPKRGKAPSVKIDVKKNSISLKNGMDFTGTFMENGEFIEPESWETILPYLKTAVVKKPGESIIDSWQYTPLDKKDSNAGKKVANTLEDGETYETYSYTAYKYKSLSIERAFECGDEGTWYLAVRKSATTKKPASEITYIEVKNQAWYPLVYTKDNVYRQELISTCTDFDKEGLKIETIIPFPGRIVSAEELEDYNRGRRTVYPIATEGYAESFKPVTSVNEGKIIDTDTDGNSFEYAIVRASDLDYIADDTNKRVDWTTVGWKKFDTAKTKITSKMKTSYKLMDGTKVSEKLTAGSPDADPKYYICIRRAGIKSGNIVASDYTMLYVVKDGKTYKLYNTKSNGEEAYKYNIKFLKYTKGEDGTYDWNETDDVETISVWMAPTAEKYVKLPDVANGKLSLVAESIDGKLFVINDELYNVVTATSGANTGKYAISTENQYREFTEYLAVKEYANIKVIASVSESGESTSVEYELKDSAIVNGKAKGETEASKFIGVGSITIKDIVKPEIEYYDLVAPTSNSGVIVSPDGLAKVTGVSSSESGEEVIVTPYTTDVTLTIKYTKTPKKYVVTKDFTNATWKMVNGIIDPDGKEKIATYKTNITFQVEPAENKVVKSVSYKVGAEGKPQTLTPSGDGVYTIPGDKITDAITITATAEDANAGN